MSVKLDEEVSAQVPADDFQALEAKVYRTIELYKSAKEAKVAIERGRSRNPAPGDAQTPQGARRGSRSGGKDVAADRHHR